jgi:putative transposase
MPRKRFTNEQIAFALRQAENGASVEEICRRLCHAKIVGTGFWARLAPCRSPSLAISIRLS